MMLNAKIVILVALGLGSAASSEVDCDPGDIWKVECNTCICTRGGVPKCTQLNCHPDAYHVTSTLGSCKPLSRWRVDCNYCTCSESGVISCTDNICDANELTSDRFRRQAEPTLPSRDACKPGVAWKDDCNRCFCRQNGKAECTQLLCFPLDMPERRKRDVELERASWKNAFDYDGQAELLPDGGLGQPRQRRLACTEGESWKDGCNSCYCTLEGTPACTKKLCSPEEQTSEKLEKRQATCNEGDTWKQGCNSCYCSKDGTPACTRKLCSPEEQALGKRDKRQAKCKPGAIWKLDCNTCHCTDDGQAACTLKGCPSQTQYYPIKQKREVKRCQPGKKWKDDCNDCVCTHTGYPSCTLKACDSQTYIVPNRKTREVKKCQPGKKWKDECNDCVCTHTGYPSCTLKACDSQTYIVPNRKTREVKKCQPGSKWKDDCNECVCTHTGYPSCTLKACPTQTDILSVKQKRQIQGAQECKPGTSWKDDCNNCFCSETGYAACTLKACLTETQLYPMTTKQKRQTQSACKPGSKWKEGCNSCTCLADGTSACTRRLCRRRRDTGQDVRDIVISLILPGYPGYPECRPAAKMCGSTSSASESQSRKREGGKLRGRGRCTPGSTWIQNCSQCYCDEQNNVECVPEESCSDDQATNQGRNKDDGLKGRGRCEPGSTWEIASQRGDWCNLCACDTNGNMNCTIRPCQKIENMSKLESETRKKRATRTNKKSERWCKPGDMYYFTCDVCPCGLKGITGCNSRTCRDRAL